MYLISFNRVCHLLPTAGHHIIHLLRNGHFTNEKRTVMFRVVLRQDRFSIDNYACVGVEPLTPFIERATRFAQN